MWDCAVLEDCCFMAGGTIDFSGPQSIATALGVLAGIIAIHECGHFAAARLQGIHVTKFAIGFGPSLLSYQVTTCLASRCPLHISKVIFVLERRCMHLHSRHPLLLHPANNASCIARRQTPQNFVVLRWTVKECSSNQQASFGSQQVSKMYHLKVTARHTSQSERHK